MKETLAERLSRLREQAGLKPHELGWRVQMTEGAIRKIESGDTKGVTFENGLKLARVLGVDPMFLAFGDAQPVTPGDDLAARVANLEATLREFLPQAAAESRAAAEAAEQGVRKPLPSAGRSKRKS